jgi:hypothetical protein
VSINPIQNPLLFVTEPQTRHNITIDLEETGQEEGGRLDPFGSGYDVCSGRLF